jgi:hypothetical protein
MRLPVLHAVREFAADMGQQPGGHRTGLAQDFQVSGRDAGQERKNACHGRACELRKRASRTL